MKYETSTPTAADNQSATPTDRRPYQAPQLQPLLGKETDGKGIHWAFEASTSRGPS